MSEPTASELERCSASPDGKHSMKRAMPHGWCQWCSAEIHEIVVTVSAGVRTSVDGTLQSEMLAALKAVVSGHVDPAHALRLARAVVTKAGRLAVPRAPADRPTANRQEG